MKIIVALLPRLLLLLMPVVVMAQQFGDFFCDTNGATITIIEYTGLGGDVVIPETINGMSVTGIGINTYTYPWGVPDVCTNLTSVVIPASVERIGTRRFWWNCQSLTNITVNERNALFSSLEGVLFNKSRKTLVQYPCGKRGAYAIPCGVTNITRGAFEDCRKMTSITIPSSVTCIGEGAFSRCTKLTIVAIPKGVTKIGKESFYGCSNLRNVTIPAGVTNIGNMAFLGCAKLKNVMIPDSVVEIGEGAFAECASLKDINVHDANTSFTSAKGVLFSKSGSALIQCPGGIEGSYAIHPRVAKICAYAFSGCDKLSNIIIPDSVTNIGKSAFENCARLSSVYFWGNAPSIDDWAFNGTDNVIVYYQPNATGWAATFSGRLTKPQQASK